MLVLSDLKIAFATLDQDEDGYITSVELRGVLEHLGYKDTSREVRRMIQIVDREGMVPHLYHLFYYYTHVFLDMW